MYKERVPQTAKKHIWQIFDTQVAATWRDENEMLGTEVEINTFGEVQTRATVVARVSGGD